MSEQKRLVKSQNKMIAGVAAGVAEYFGIDPVIARLGFVVAALLGSAGFWAYVILWVVMPSE